MITKTYTSSTNASVNVVLPNKKNLRVAFSPLSNGTSVFITSDPNIQTALEQHYKFKSLFKLSNTVDSTPTKQAARSSIEATLHAEPKSTEPAAGEEPVADEEPASENPNLIKVTVTDLPMAKDYLADRFGVSRTAIRLTSQVIAFAAANNIEFVGI